MSTITASHPVHGHSLFAAAARFFATMFSVPKAPATVKLIKPVSAVDTGPNLWKLYRMSAAMDSVNPELFIDRIEQV
jgi:hypothetical protein